MKRKIEKWERESKEIEIVNPRYIKKKKKKGKREKNKRKGRKRSDASNARRERSRV